MTEKKLREKVVATATAWLGCRESDGSHRKIIDTYNGHKPLARSYAVKYTDAWCSTYASAVAIKADMADIVPLECSCEKHIDLFRRLGRWMENDAYVPQPGDYIFYDWDDTGAGDCTGAADHVGIVTKVSGQAITVIEGNKSDSVCYRTMQVNGRYIRGYGIPDYAGKAEKTGGGPVEPQDLPAPSNLTYTAAAAISKLARLGVINSPDYWRSVVASGAVKHLDTLLVKAAGKVKGAGVRSSTVANGVGDLMAAGVINTPEYWLANYCNTASLGALLCALGGAVK